MKTKLFGVVALSVFFLAVLISGVSATQTTFSFSYVNQSYSPSASTLGLQNITGISTSSPISGYVGGQNFGSFSVAKTDNTTLSLKLASIDSSNNYYGSTGSVTFNVTGYVNSTATKNVPVTLSFIKSFCNYGDLNASSSQLGEMSVSVTNDGQGDSTNWNSLDTVKVEVTVYNNNNYDLNNMNLELGLIQKGTNNNIANRLDWISGDGSKVSLDTISSDDSVTYTFEFKVDPKIISSGSLGSGDYYLMVKSYQSDQSGTCVDYSSDFNDPVKLSGGNSYGSDVYLKSADYNHAVVIDQSSLPLSTNVQCGQQISLDPAVYNIGSSGNSYSKNQILVEMYSPIGGGITQNQTIYGDLNAGNSVQLPTPFTFTVPRNADEKSYPVYFTIYYGYNENSGTYFGNYNKISSDSFSTNVNVQGSCVYATAATTSVQAQLQSGGKAGEPLVIQATIQNTGTKTVNYNLGLEGYTSWATLSSITPSNITLAAGQSQTVMINMNVNSAATSGEKQFSLDVYSNGYLITQQPLSLSITAKFWNSITGGAISGSSAALWGFNILLIIAIIVVLILVLRRRK